MPRWRTPRDRKAPRGMDEQFQELLIREPARTYTARTRVLQLC